MTESKPLKSRLPDSDMQNASAALIRAAKRARKLAEQAGTEFVYVKDGRLIREVPKPDSKDEEHGAT